MLTKTHLVSESTCMSCSTTIYLLWCGSLGFPGRLRTGPPVGSGAPMASPQKPRCFQSSSSTPLCWVSLCTPFHSSGDTLLLCTACTTICCPAVQLHLLFCAGAILVAVNTSGISDGLQQQYHTCAALTRTVVCCLQPIGRISYQAHLLDIVLRQTGLFRRHHLADTLCLLQEHSFSR